MARLFVFWTLVSVNEKLWGYQTTKLKHLWQLQVKSTFYFLAFANKELLTLSSTGIRNERVIVLFIVVQLNLHHTTVVIQRWSSDTFFIQILLIKREIITVNYLVLKSCRKMTRHRPEPLCRFLVVKNTVHLLFKSMAECSDLLLCYL